MNQSVSLAYQIISSKIKLASNAQAILINVQSAQTIFVLTVSLDIHYYLIINVQYALKIVVLDVQKTLSKIFPFRLFVEFV